MNASDASPRDLLIGSFHAAVSAVMPDRILPTHLPAPPDKGRTLVVGAGKAAAAMAACVEAHWPADAPLSGLVITRHGHGLASSQPNERTRIRTVEAGHPLPDMAGLAATEDLISLVQAAGPDDRVLALISGGGSSLLTLPAEGLELGDVRAVTYALLVCGAPIADINCVRKHLSRCLGGRLAEQCRASARVLMISDVTGDDPSVIASGPFAPDPTTYADALAVLARWGIHAPDTIQSYLDAGAAGLHDDTPKAGADCFARIEHRLLGNGRSALEGAAAYFSARDIKPVILGDTFTGEAREVAQAFAALAREVRRNHSPWQPPVVLLSGGETSVKVRGNGLGGRNAEFQLALALALDGLAGVHAVAADTDGIDGVSDAAGAYIDPRSLRRALAMGLSPNASLNDNDAHRFFAALDDQIVTGPTRTNANDFRAILIT